MELQRLKDLRRPDADPSPRSSVQDDRGLVSRPTRALNSCRCAQKKPVGERAPHKSTPLRAAPYFRPDPFHGSPSRSSLANRLLVKLYSADAISSNRIPRNKGLYGIVFGRSRLLPRHIKTENVFRREPQPPDYRLETQPLIRDSFSNRIASSKQIGVRGIGNDMAGNPFRQSTDRHVRINAQRGRNHRSIGDVKPLMNGR
jgi:hypothetical protein